jgi:hypothetical protein
MPAVQIARLKHEIADLCDQFEQPLIFKRRLDDLLEFYADRVYRAGQNVPFRPQTPSHHVSALVIQQLELSLRIPCFENKPAALLLADTLWLDPFLEMRRLSVYILGQVTLDPPEPVLQRLQEWAKPQEPGEILKLLFTGGTARLRREMAPRWLESIQVWLDSSNLDRQELGLMALLPIVEDPQFDNLPPIFRMIGPFMVSTKPELLPELQDVLEGLARRSSTETLFFIRQILGSPTPSGITRMIRRLLPLFPPESQTSLKKMLLVRTS